VLIIGAGFAGLRAVAGDHVRSACSRVPCCSSWCTRVFWLDGELGRLIRSYVGVADVMPA
jgi:hypothetical protein